MASVVAKKKAQPRHVAPKARRLTEVERLVDVIVQNAPIIEAAKKPAKQTKDARDELLELSAGMVADDKEIVLRGTLGSVVFSARSDTLECTDLKRVHEMLGDDFYDLVTVPIGGLKEQLSKRQLKEVTKPCKGARRMSVVPARLEPAADTVS